MYTVIFTLELPINGRFISFSVRFVGVRWGSYLILVYPFKCVANSTSLNNNSLSKAAHFTYLPFQMG